MTGGDKPQSAFSAEHYSDCMRSQQDMTTQPEVSNPVLHLHS